MSSGSLKACLHPGEEGRKGRGYQECRKTITSSAGRALSPLIVTPQEVFSSAPRIRPTRHHQKPRKCCHCGLMHV